MPAKNRRRGHCAAVDERGQLPVLFVRTTGEGIRGSEGIFELTARKQKLFPCSGSRRRVPAAHMPSLTARGAKSLRRENAEAKCIPPRKDSAPRNTASYNTALRGISIPEPAANGSPAAAQYRPGTAAFSECQPLHPPV